MGATIRVLYTDDDAETHNLHISQAKATAVGATKATTAPANPIDALMHLNNKQKGLRPRFARVVYNPGAGAKAKRATIPILNKAAYDAKVRGNIIAYNGQNYEITDLVDEQT